jgi:hypothetical protein
VVFGGFDRVGRKRDPVSCFPFLLKAEFFYENKILFDAIRALNPLYILGARTLLRGMAQSKIS